MPHLERRTGLAAGPVPGAARPLQISRASAWLIVAVALCLTGLADLATGTNIWLGPAYLLIIGIASWLLGWREAVAVGFACVGVTTGANGLNLYPYGTLAAAWNLAMRLVSVLMIVALLNHARRSYVREWRLARTDPLTGALNRQAFFEMIGAAPSSHAWHLLAYCDLDGLKKLNDERGHEAGDLCLRAYAAHVKKAVRTDDIFARFGGDEFLLYLAVRDEAAAQAVATRLHRAMNEATARTGGVRCSIGALILPPGGRAIDTEIKLADELMYEAKACGAALTLATAYERGGIRYVVRHWEHERSFDHEGRPARKAQAQRVRGRASATYDAAA